MRRVVAYFLSDRAASQPIPIKKTLSALPGRISEDSRGIVRREAGFRSADVRLLRGATKKQVRRTRLNSYRRKSLPLSEQRASLSVQFLKAYSPRMRAKP